MSTALLDPTSIAPIATSIPAIEPALPGPLAELFDKLDRHSQRIPLATLVDHLERLDLPQAAFSSLTEFDRQEYTRTVLHTGPAYEALILCWLPEQHSPIHDHRGSNCALRVLMGTATETLFTLDEKQRAHAGEQKHYTTGFVAASSDWDVHRVSNLDGEDLVTLHIYSTPLTRMGTYTSA